jgi:hypothetical protein
MKGIYGYNTLTGRYWYKIECMNVEVKTGKNLTRKQMDQVRSNHVNMLWHKDYELVG